MHGNNKISAYPDFPAEVQRRRATFLKVKTHLRSLDMKYALLFPAKLRVIDGDTTRFFTTPEDTWTWLHARGLANHTVESLSDKEWNSPRPQRKRNRRPERGPTRSQKELERSKTIEAVSLHIHNSYSPLQGMDTPGKDSEGDDTSESREAERRLPVLTPRSADDLG